MAITVEARGMEFSFPDGTSSAQIGQAVDEYFQNQAPDTVERWTKDKFDNSWTGKAWEALTGNNRMTPTMEKLDNVTAAPELNGAGDMAQKWRTAFSQLFASDKTQMEQIAKMGGKFSQDEKGNTGTWDNETALWDNSSRRISQGVMIGSCAAVPSIYYLNTGYKESRHVYSKSAWAMVEQPLKCYVERRGLEFGVGQRYMIQATYLNGKGTDPLTVKVGRADNPDGGYTWDSQDIASLATQRRQTWRAEGEVHGYRLEIAGRGAIPVGISFTTVSTGSAY